MPSSLQGKTVLLLGGSGLVGRSVIESLIQQRVGNIAVVGITGEVGWKKLTAIEKKHHVRIRKYAVNLLLPPQFAKQSQQEVFSQSTKWRKLLKEVSGNLSQKDVERLPLFKIIRDVRPHIIVDAINTATQCAYIEQSARAIENAGLGTLLLLRYFQVLHHLLSHDFWSTRKIRAQVAQYLKVGTTGIGGMGLDIPFTHGEERPSTSLMKKVAMAGAQTNILVAMQHSHGLAKIQEVVPATAIFQLSHFAPFSKTAGHPNQAQYSEIDGGESQGYSLEEFRLLTDQRQMGLIDAEELGAMITDALRTGHSRHDILGAMDRASVRRSARSANSRQEILKRWTSDQTKHHVTSIAHGHLGPWRTRKLLFELTLLLEYHKKHRQQFFRHSPKKIQHELLITIAADKSFRQEVRLAHLRLRRQGSAKPVTADREIDLSTNNITKWRKTLITLGIRKARTPWFAGDVLATLVSQRHDLRQIP